MKSKGLTLIEVVVVAAAITLAAGVLMPGLYRSRQTAVRLLCQTNLTGIGGAMRVYSSDNEGHYPQAGSTSALWTTLGVIANWGGGRRVVSEDGAFGIDRDGDGFIRTCGKATITSSFYLLIKCAMATPKQFICKGDKGAKVFELSRLPRAVQKDMTVCWDFGDSGSGVPLPGEFCSYAYHMPYWPTCHAFTSYPITEVSSPAMPVCADRNPFLDKNVTEPRVGDNSAAHMGTGQNVLYKDGSVRFEKTPTVGIAGDNIYTYGGDPNTGGGDPNGTAPTGSGNGFPAGEKDSYLVGEQNYDE